MLARYVEVIIGDGGFGFCMEKRGYVKAGMWTPEANVEQAEAGNHMLSFNGQ